MEGLAFSTSHSMHSFSRNFKRAALQKLTDEAISWTNFQEAARKANTSTGYQATPT